MVTRIDIAAAGRHTTAAVYPAERDRRLGATLVLAHGAGAGQASRFMTQLAAALATRGLDVVTFDFFYAAARKKVPDRADVLEACYRAVIDAVRGDTSFADNRLFIGGKSMGGRIASYLAAAGNATAAAISGLVLLGYPLHPPGRPDQLRVAHLPSIRVPVFIAQGDRDPFGTPEELRPHLAAIRAPVTLHVVAGGDHSLAPSGGGGRRPDPASAYAEVHDAIAAWSAATPAASLES